MDMNALDNASYIPIDTCTSEQTNQFLKSVQRRIRLVWHYPDDAKKDGIEGEVYIDFSIETDGRVSNVNISSNNEPAVLNNGAIESITMASPFQNIPACVSNPINIRGRFKYTIMYIRFQ